MSMQRGPHEDNEAHRSMPERSGMDEDLFFFFTSLIEQNAQLAGKLEEIDSLKKLAEETLSEAQKAAEIIKTEAERKAKEEAAAIIAKADEEARAAAQNIIDRAREKAEEEAHKIIAEAKQKAEAAERKALEIIRAAEEKAESIGRRSEEETSKLIAEARRRAEEDARAIRQEAEEILKSSRKAVEVERKARHGREMPPGSEVEAPVIYEDIVELFFTPPISLDKLQKMRKRLRDVPQIRILDLRGSLDNGVRMRLRLHEGIPLLKILCAFPEVWKASDMPIEGGGVGLERQKGLPLRRIAVTMKR